MLFPHISGHPNVEPACGLRNVFFKPVSSVRVSAASSIVTTQSLAEAIATAIVVDALATTPIVSSSGTATHNCVQIGHHSFIAFGVS